MSQITTELVKELRDKTGISVMQCRKALEEAQGNMEKALAILKKSSSDIAMKKSDREARDGAVIVKNKDNKSVLLVLNCETDFVAKNEDFTNLLNSLADLAINDGIEKMKASAKEMIDQVVQKTGENIQIGEVFEITGDVLGSYVHNGKSAVIVSLTGGNSDLAKDIAMHVAAMKPEYFTLAEIEESTKQTVKEIFEKEVASIDKPADIKAKMLEGKMSGYFKEKTLTEQPFIKNGDETISSLLSKAGAQIKEIKRYSI